MSDRAHQWTALDALGARCTVCGVTRRSRGEGRALVWVFVAADGARWTSKARFGGRCPPTKGAHPRG